MKSVGYYSLLVLLLLTACQSDTKCRLPMVASPRVAVHAKGSFAKGTKLTVFGVGREDSVIYSNTNLSPKLSLPLKGDTTQTQFVFQTGNNFDTLTFFHTNHLRYVSLACGCAIHYRIDSVFGTARLDSVTLLNSGVETVMIDDNVSLLLLP